MPLLNGKYASVGKVDHDDMSRITELAKQDTDRNTDAPRKPVKIKSITLNVVK
jgi:cyclophilin family peptidyl-prolyl cis-trans isomerase